MENFWANSDLKSDLAPLGMSGFKPTAVLSEPSPTNTSNVEALNTTNKENINVFIISLKFGMVNKTHMKKVRG